ncbi:MAG TPA: stage II sporulation protein M [Patescibacteria group bacterium]
MEQINRNFRHIRRCFFVAAIFFVGSIFFGYLLALADPTNVFRLVEQTLSGFSFVKHLNSFLIFAFIFLNNAIKGLIVMIAGTVFGIVPLLFIFINGQLVGLVIGSAYFLGNPWSTVLGLIPHGIFEVPAIIMSSGYGVWLGYRFYRFLRFGENFAAYFSFALRKYMRVIVPLLFVAALIETFITPYILKSIK